MVNLLLSLNNFDENWCYNILKNIIKEDYKVLIVPFSYDEKWLSNESDWSKAFNSKDGTHYEEIVSPFLAYGIDENNIKWINQFTDTIDLMKEKIKDTDIIFFTGGYPDKMMQRFKKYDLINELENFKGIMIGTSAGAMVQISEFHITKDSDYKRYLYCKGLNIIKDFDIEVHFENKELQNLSILRCLKEKKKVVYSISNDGAILVIDGQIYVLGDAEKWDIPKCYY
ncbi:Type 1 glutamine amidotransferase-like domain-containing protein [Romboutsia sp. 13368]|uniref:Type 1 glutamine amidotransferase-like domain-containing protein n=1 Tax=Romboutsia sp. 13368 TaxID=2708053 RepID=UPI0025DB26B4|nr:Type 1 glutamine amidotransferase-like domain-containing protein [Romboutsia sp. 13368]